MNMFFFFYFKIKLFFNFITPKSNMICLLAFIQNSKFLIIKRISRQHLVYFFKWSQIKTWIIWIILFYILIVLFKQFFVSVGNRMWQHFKYWWHSIFVVSVYKFEFKINFLHVYFYFFEPVSRADFYNFLKIKDSFFWLYSQLNYVFLLNRCIDYHI